jgi:hypothetical protein
MKNQPITAKIKRTTKGGITQPLLNMGAPVKMMAPPPAPVKQVGALVKQVGKALIKKGSQSMLPAVRNVGVSTTKKAIQKSAPRTIEVVGKTVANPKNTGGGFMNIAKKVMKLGALGLAGYGISKLGEPSGEGISGYDNNDDGVKPTVKPTVKPKKKKSYDQAFEDRGKRYKNMDKASYIKEAKRQNAVHKKTGKWDVKDNYDSRPKVEKVTTIKAEPIVQKKVEITSKLDPKDIKAKVTTKPTAAKPTKSQKLRAKGNAVLADKSLSTEDKQRKAQKIRKRYDKTVKRETNKAARKGRKVKYDETTGKGGSVAGNLLRSVTGKRTRDRKKSQASKAIDPTKAL